MKALFKPALASDTQTLSLWMALKVLRSKSTSHSVVVVIDVYLCLTAGWLSQSWSHGVWFSHQGCINTGQFLVFLEVSALFQFRKIWKYLKLLRLSFSTLLRLTRWLKHFGFSYFWCSEAPDVPLVEAKLAPLKWTATA